MTGCVYWRGISVTHSCEVILCTQTSFPSFHDHVSVVESKNGSVGPCWRHVLRYVFMCNHQLCKGSSSEAGKASGMGVTLQIPERAPSCQQKTLYRWTDHWVSALAWDGNSHPFSQPHRNACLGRTKGLFLLPPQNKRLSSFCFWVISQGESVGIPHIPKQHCKK